MARGNDTELVPIRLPQLAATRPDLESRGREGSSLPLQEPEGETPTAINMQQQQQQTEQALAPIDGGSAAWRLLCAAFLFEALLWGKVAP